MPLIMIREIFRSHNNVTLKKSSVHVK